MITESSASAWMADRGEAKCSES